MGYKVDNFCDLCQKSKLSKELSTVCFTYGRRAYSSDHFRESFLEVNVDVCKDCEKVEETVKDFIQNSLKKKFK
ncbi:MAG: hypothetical protein ACHQWH_03835 [Nitrososphaerales archaeon]